MASNTTNYGLTKPDKNEYYDISVQNGNMDKIDEQLKANHDTAAAAITGATFGGTAVPQNGTKLEIPMPTAAQVGASNPNLAHNGNFSVCQRGVTQSTDTLYSTVDRWVNSPGNSVSGADLPTVQISRFVCTDGSMSSHYYIETKVIAIPNETGFENFLQIMEDSDDLCPLAGKTITLSADVWCDNDYRCLFITYATSDNSYHTTVTPCAKSISKRYSTTVTLPNDARFLQYGVGVLRLFTASDVGTITHISDVKLELGSVATPFAPRPYAEELALCKRYFGDLAGSYRMSFYSTDYVEFGIPQLHDMRIAPTLIVSETQGTDWVVTDTKYGNIGFDWTLGVTGYRDIIATKTNHGQTDTQLMIHPGYVFADAEIY